MTVHAPEKDLSPRDRLAPGSRYELLARIASGGMGTVYLARLRGPQGFERLVALKRAHDHLVHDPNFARMFRAEARLASRLHHPNVVAVHDIEELEGELVLVMDYVQGSALSSLLTASTRYPLDPQIALRILLDAAAGLEAAHTLKDERGRALGVVHRDVSPENVLVGTDGVARISDFGVAKIVRATAGATDGRDLKGKLAYMAPECVRRGKIDARSDVFALGILAWEALTEKRLFRAQSEVATLQRVIGMTPEAPSALRAGLPAAIDDVVLRALEKMPDARWPSARAFADALELAAREGGLAPATPAQVGEHVWRCVGHVLDARHRAVQEGRVRSPAQAAAEPAHEVSVARRTASIAHGRTPAADPDSIPTGLVVNDVRPFAIPHRTPTSSLRTPTTTSAFSVSLSRAHAHFRTTRGMTRALASAAALVFTMAAVLFFASSEPPSTMPHRSLASLREGGVFTEFGGVLPETALPAPAPAPISPRSSIRADRTRSHPLRATTPRDHAAPNPYGPSPSSLSFK